LTAVFSEITGVHQHAIKFLGIGPDSSQHFAPCIDVLAVSSEQQSIAYASYAEINCVSCAEIATSRALAGSKSRQPLMYTGCTELQMKQDPRCKKGR
jgi:hypothetical protein